VADYRVILEPEDTFIGTLNEDFAIESMAATSFSSETPPGVCCGLARERCASPTRKGRRRPAILAGEAPARTSELSQAVSDLRGGVNTRLERSGASAIEWLETVTEIPTRRQSRSSRTPGRPAGAGSRSTQDTLVIERFFDEAGGMQLVCMRRSAAASTKAWGLALRKRFCRQFNFELQAAATDERCCCRLGRSTRSRWRTSSGTCILHRPRPARPAVLDARYSRRVALEYDHFIGRSTQPWRQESAPAASAHARRRPDGGGVSGAARVSRISRRSPHSGSPLVAQTVHDCLHEAMDFEGLAAVLDRIHRGTVQLLARDTPEPSPLAHEILNARPYAFLDDAPLEERRTQAVYARRATEPSSARSSGRSASMRLSVCATRFGPIPRRR
jgi:ATP-dependent Lhr-like helicase